MRPQICWCCCRRSCLQSWQTALSLLAIFFCIYSVKNTQCNTASLGFQCHDPVRTTLHTCPPFLFIILVYWQFLKTSASYGGILCYKLHTVFKGWSFCLIWPLSSHHPLSFHSVISFLNVVGIHLVYKQFTSLCISAAFIGVCFSSLFFYKIKDRMWYNQNQETTLTSQFGCGIIICSPFLVTISVYTRVSLHKAAIYFQEEDVWLATNKHTHTPIIDHTYSSALFFSV